MSHSVESILKQVKETTVQIGHIQGHFISTAQVKAIERALESGFEFDFGGLVLDPPTPVALSPLRDYEDQVKLLDSTVELRRAELLACNDSKQRTNLNEIINTHLSERARLQRAIKRLQS